MTPALHGIRILDFTHFVAGPWATSLLGDFGADVIKIERPGEGDGSRHLDQVFDAGMSSYFVGMNRGKRSFAIDLHSDAGREAVHRLLETTDVVIANYRPGVMERLGLGYTQLAQHHKRLIYVSITAFGPEGPLAAAPAMDIVVQAVGGVMGLTGDPSSGPVKVGAPVADFVGAYMAFSAIALGLYVRQVQGIGQRIDINLIDGQVSLLANYVAGHAVTGEPEGPQGGGHPQIVPYQVFATSDHPIVVGCLTEGFWRAFCGVLGRTDLVSDERFLTNSQRVHHRAELIPLIERLLGTRNQAAWLATLTAHGVPCAAVSTVAQVVSNEQIRRNGMIVEMPHPAFGSVRLVGNPLHLSGTPPRIGGPAPWLGQHTAEILHELGYSPTEAAAIVADDQR
jgi:crotonobetainyl-CoA:carnitine CoA-transferase CaiB-like acyl-CoA transferase